MGGQKRSAMPLIQSSLGKQGYIILEARHRAQAFVVLGQSNADVELVFLDAMARGMEVAEDIKQKRLQLLVFSCVAAQAEERRSYLSKECQVYRFLMCRL